MPPLPGGGPVTERSPERVPLIPILPQQIDPRARLVLPPHANRPPHRPVPLEPPIDAHLGPPGLLRRRPLRRVVRVRPALARPLVARDGAHRVADLVDQA